MPSLRYKAHNYQVSDYKVKKFSLSHRQTHNYICLPSYSLSLSDSFSIHKPILSTSPATVNSYTLCLSSPHHLFILSFFLFTVLPLLTINPDSIRKKIPSKNQAQSSNIMILAVHGSNSIPKNTTKKINIKDHT